MNKIFAVWILLTAYPVTAISECYLDPFVAINSGNEAALMAYLAEGGSANLFQPQKGSLLFFAAMKKEHSIARALIESGANYLREPDGRSPVIEVAVVQNDTFLLDEILKQCHACLEHRLGGYTLLMIAAMEGANKSVSYLLEQGAKVASLSTTGKHRTALFYAITGKHFQVAEAIAKESINIETRCGQQSSIAADIDIAIAAGEREVATYLEKLCLPDLSLYREEGKGEFRVRLSYSRFHGHPGRHTMPEEVFHVEAKTPRIEVLSASIHKW